LSTAPPPPLHAGRPWPLGASFDGRGVNIAVFSEHAEGIELCLFDAHGHNEAARIALPARSGDIWHGRLDGAASGLVYGLRAHGPWRPADGQRFNARKLLLDPYAREIVGDFEWRDEHLGFDPRDPSRPDDRDNAAQALKARVVDDAYDWGDDAPPATAVADTVIYELHVRSFTKRHPDVPAAQRGSFAGLASPAALAHLRKLGVTAVCLLPVQHFIDEQRLVSMGLRNHWGYNTIGYFSLQPRYGAHCGPPHGANRDGRALRDEFRDMVRRLHRAGIEVILDVVYNHTAETDAAGPTLAWRGLDNASYYRLDVADRSRYLDYSGCGNTLNLGHPRVQQMVLDSLRHWVREMHVDGFRFDLASVLGRAGDGFDRHAPFFASLAQDPTLAGVKLIAEPWDLGPGGYRLGQFPGGWLEWNDRFRDTARAFWLRGHTTRGEFAHRLCASAQQFQHRHRAPGASVNHVVAHDGFSLLDLVSYERRRNEANGEGNRDGHAHNLGWNCGAEGPSDDPAVQQRRGWLQRALLATTVLAQGTPMLACGAELGHSQGGNNNAYCQDNGISWIDWSRADAQLTDFTARLLALRRRCGPFGADWSSADELHWFGTDGRPLRIDDWHDAAARTLGVRIARRHRRALLLLVNAGADAATFELPPGSWQPLLDTSQAAGAVADDAIDGAVPLGPHRLVLLGAAPSPEAGWP